MLSGRFRVSDLRIDGVHPGDRPFFSARQIDVGIDWLPLVREREVLISSVEMTDWQMLVEKWEEGHNFPKFGNDEGTPAGPKRVTTTLRRLRARRGRFAYEDHEAPWSVDCPNLDITIGNVPNYHGVATFEGGAVKVQDFAPMWTNMKAAFVLDGSRIQLDRVDLTTDGATTVARGTVDLSHWPEMSYDVESRVHFPRMREIFFRDEKWDVAGDGDFKGRFHLFKGGRDLSGAFTSARLDLKAAGKNYAFPHLFGSLRWTPAVFEVWDAGAGVFGGAGRFAYSIKPLNGPGPKIARFDALVQGGRPDCVYGVRRAARRPVRGRGLRTQPARVAARALFGCARRGTYRGGASA